MADETQLSVRTLEQTCWAVPSQWEGRLDDGRMFYVRFRNGHFEVRVSSGPTDDIRDAVGAPACYEWYSEDAHDGFMDEATMMERAAAVLDFSLVRSDSGSEA